MTSVRQEFLGHHSAWKAADFESPDEITFDLGPKHIAALEWDLQSVRERGLGLYEITRQDFPLTAIADDIARIREELYRGRGIVFLRTFPIDRYSEEDVGTMYWGLGTHLGTALSQSVLGDRLGRVTNHGDFDPNERAYRNRRQLMPHTDRSHIIGMLCIRPAKTGGISGYVNGLAVHNVVASEHPEHLPILYRGFGQHRFGEQPADEPPISPPTPIFSVCNGVPSMQYIRGYYDMAMEELEQEYTEPEAAALDFMDEVTLRPEMKLDIVHAPGEASFINNYVVMHSRTSFEEHDDPARKRLLLRLWLYAPESRPLVEALQLDEIRAGVPEQKERKSSYFTAWKRK